MTIFSFRRGAPAVALALSIASMGMLAGCATTGAPGSGAAVAAYRDALDLSGRILVNFSRDGKKESLSGNFTWHQSKDSTDVSLISPTGQTVAVIKVAPGLATLKQSGEPVRSAPDLDSLTRQALGWSLPVSGLRDWLQGHAVASDGSRFVASPSNDSVVTGDGWKIDYVSWQDPVPAPLPVQGGDRAARPKRIDVTRIALGQQVDDMTIRIVIAP